MANKQILDGQVLYLEFNGQQLQSAYRAFDPAIAGVTVDSTAGSDELETQHKIRETVRPTLEILVDDSATGQLIFNALKVGATGNLIWGPKGNGTGNPKWGISAEVHTSNTSFSYDSEQMLMVEFNNLDPAFVFDGRTDVF